MFLLREESLFSTSSKVSSYINTLECIDSLLDAGADDQLYDHEGNRASNYKLNGSNYLLRKFQLQNRKIIGRNTYKNFIWLMLAIKSSFAVNRKLRVGHHYSNFGHSVI